MKAIVNSFNDLGIMLGRGPKAPKGVIPDWYETKVNLIGQMLEAVKDAMLPVRYDRGSMAFCFEKEAMSGYPIKRKLWTKDGMFLFGDFDGHVYETSADLSYIIGRVLRLSQSRLIKK